MSLDAGAKGSIDERTRRIEDYYNVFKIEINKEYFLDKANKTSQKRRASAKFFSINQKNAFNFDIDRLKQPEQPPRNSLMNTSIDKIKLDKQKEGDAAEKGSDQSERDRRKRSTFFIENSGVSPKDRRQSNKKSIYAKEVRDYQRLPDTKFKSKPRFSLDVNEYQAPGRTGLDPGKPPKSRLPFRTSAALYNNRILEEPPSKGASPQQVPGERTVSSKVYPSPRVRSMSLRESKATENCQASLRPRASLMYSHYSHDNNCSGMFDKLANPEQLNQLLQKQSEPPLQNWSMFPNRPFPKLHNSNNILPNSEDLRNPKIKPKASLQSNVRQLRFQNYQTIVSLKSEMNLHSKKLNYKKKQRQVLKNFRHPQSPFVDGRPTFKSSSSIESGDSDQELKLDKAYCLLCGEDFG